MSQPQPLREHIVSDLFLVQNSANFCIGSFRAGQRNEQIDLRSTADDVTYTSQHAVDFSECSESIDVHGRHSNGLQKQFLVLHVSSPAVTGVDRSTSAKHNATFQLLSDVHDAAVSPLRFAARRICQRYHEALNHVREFGKRASEPRFDDPGAILTANQNNPHNASDDLHLVNSIKENFLGVMWVDHINHLHSPRGAQ